MNTFYFKLILFIAPSSDPPILPIYLSVRAITTASSQFQLPRDYIIPSVYMDSILVLIDHNVPALTAPNRPGSLSSTNIQ